MDEGTAVILATSRKELRERKPIDIGLWLTLRTGGAEYHYQLQTVLLTKSELDALLDRLEELDPASDYDVPTRVGEPREEPIR